MGMTPTETAEADTILDVAIEEVDKVLRPLIWMKISAVDDFVAAESIQVQ